EYAWTDDQIEPVGYVLPLGDNGPGVAIVDAVSVTSSPRFAPSTLRQALIGHLDHAGCIALGPFTGHGSVLPGCAPSVLKSAAGAAVEVTQFRSVERVQAALVLELSAPRPGRCWDITAVVIRYHVGIRHYAATFPEGDVIACGPGGKVPDSLDL
ncbi:MAG: hypothetical protein J2P29_11100, partial [Actinobacteria bacterium]|nr:hypothetical protein [Actinomycetota bacterium]